MTSPAVASVAPLLVKDVPGQLPANMSSMEQGWLLYRCDRAEAISHGEYRDEPCSSVPMGKVQRGYDLRQTALGWQRQTIVGWRLAAQLEGGQLRSVADQAWRYTEFLVVEDDNTLHLPQVDDGAALVYAAVAPPGGGGGGGAAMLALFFVVALLVLLPLSFRAAVALHPEGGEGAEQELLKLLPPTVLELLGPLLGLRGYGAPGARSEVDEAQWHPAADPANPFPLSVHL